MLSSKSDVNTALAQQRRTRGGNWLNSAARMLATLALPERYLAQTVAAVGKAQKAGAGLAAVPGLHRMLGIDAAIEPSRCRRRRSRSALVGVPRGDHGRRRARTPMRCSTGSSRNEKGKYLVVVEGAIPTAEGGIHCMINGHTALEIAERVCRNAAATIAVGACAFDGGLVRAKPNPTGALGVQEAVPGIKVINMAGCPHNPVNTAAVLVHYLTFNDLPSLDQYNRPLFAYGRIIHDQCERRAHYDAGRFVTEWGDEGHRKGWCLYKMGCKGPAATFNCPVVQWNDHTSWPIRAGHGCIGCASPRFWDHMSPFYDRCPPCPVSASKSRPAKSASGWSAPRLPA